MQWRNDETSNILLLSLSSKNVKANKNFMLFHYKELSSNEFKTSVQLWSCQIDSQRFEMPNKHNINLKLQWFNRFKISNKHGNINEELQWFNRLKIPTKHKNMKNFSATVSWPTLASPDPSQWKVRSSSSSPSSNQQHVPPMSSLSSSSRLTWLLFRGWCNC